MAGESDDASEEATEADADVAEADADVAEADADVAEADADVRFEPDPERVERLREVAADVRGESSESEQLANILYRTSDIYDPDEETTPEEVMQNVKFILEVKERGGLGR